MLEQPKVDIIQATVNGGSGVYHFYLPAAIDLDVKVPDFKWTLEIIFENGYLPYPFSDIQFDDKGRAYPYKCQYIKEVIPVLDSWLAYLSEQAHIRWEQASKNFINGYRDPKRGGNDKKAVQAIKAENTRLKNDVMRSKRLFEKSEKWISIMGETKAFYEKYMRQ